MAAATQSKQRYKLQGADIVTGMQAWRSRIIGIGTSELHWLRYVIARQLSAIGVEARNVRRQNNYWWYTSDGRAWRKVSDALADHRESV